MSFENPQNIIRSWNLQTNFATGPVFQDKLVPPKFGRIRTNFVTTWREENCLPCLDFGAENISVYLPESLRVVSSIYLRIDLPALPGNAAYKDYPALYVIKTLRLLSGGQEIYACDCAVMFGDYLQSLNDEQVRVFGKTYLGHQDTMDGTARSVMIPILLPNSAYGSRNGHDTRGHGVFPAYLGSSRLELQFTLNPATYPSADVNHPVPSILDACSLMYHEVKMTGNNIKKYQDLRGGYSIVNRRFTELTSGWKEYASANTEVTIRHSQPQGTVTEIQFIAVADNSDPSRHTFAYIKPSSLKVTADAIVQRDLNTAQKVDAELWMNGFVPPADFPSPGRLCFASHAAEASHIYSGGYNMNLASNVDFTFSFPSACRYRIFAVQLQRIKIDSAGVIRAFLT